MKKSRIRKTIGITLGFLCVGMLTSFPVQAAVENGWEIVDGNWYWYEKGAKQGTEGRGKEIYDPISDAWYWLDAVQDGAKATDKDVYQESSGGKWVRYDTEGRMIKGEDYRYDGWYYFEPITGTMIKGPAILSDGRKVFYDTVTGQMVKGSITINGQIYTFDENTGELLSGAEGLFWLNMDGKDYWYENWTRQGWDTSNEAYRGKEVYDPVSDAWYWLDNVQQGAKAVSKDVYQESQADDAGNIGKWVRYDENGHMIKGWSTNENGTYYFDLTYGTMIKGKKEIDGKVYFFDKQTGIKKDIYEAVLDQYKEALKNNLYIDILNGKSDDWDSIGKFVNTELLGNARYYKNYGGRSEENFYVYYSLADINNDGIDELFIDAGTGKEFSSVYDVFSYDGEQVIPLFHVGEFGYRSQLFIHNDNTLVTEGSGGAFYQVIEYYYLPENSCKPILIKQYDREEEQYFYTDENGKVKSITEQEYREVQQQVDSNLKDLSWILLTAE